MSPQSLALATLGVLSLLSIRYLLSGGRCSSYPGGDELAGVYTSTMKDAEAVCSLRETEIQCTNRKSEVQEDQQLRRHSFGKIACCTPRCTPRAGIHCAVSTHVGRTRAGKVVQGGRTVNRAFLHVQGKE